MIYTLKPVYAQEPERGFFLWWFPAVPTSRVFSRILPPQVLEMDEMTNNFTKEISL